MSGDSDLRHTPLAELSVETGVRPGKPDLGTVQPGARRAGLHLAAIHRHYLGDLARIAEVLQRVKAGDAPPAELAHIVLDTDMAQNLRAVGTICGQECGVLKTTLKSNLSFLRYTGAEHRRSRRLSTGCKPNILWFTRSSNVWLRQRKPFQTRQAQKTSNLRPRSLTGFSLSCGPIFTTKRPRWKKR